MSRPRRSTRASARGCGSSSARSPAAPRARRGARLGTSVLFSTHHLGEVRRYATRAIVLADGELLFDGAPAGADRGERAGAGDDLEEAFVAFLAERGH